MDDKKKKQKSKRSVIPIYAIGAVWLLYIGKLGTIRGVISCAVVSAIVYAILRIVLPGSKQPEQAPEAAAQPQAAQPEPEKQEPPKEAEKTEKIPPELQSVINQGNTSIAKIRQLNDAIPDERMSAQIDLIERLAAQIFDCVKALKDVEVKAPVKIGDVIVENVAGTGVNIIATKNVG